MLSALLPIQLPQEKVAYSKKYLAVLPLRKAAPQPSPPLARRPAEIFWIMTVKQVPYKMRDEKEYELQPKQKVIKNIGNKMNRLGLTTDGVLNLSGLQPFNYSLSQRVRWN